MSLFGETPWYSTIDPRIWQAVIAGAFVSFGWLVNGWQNRRSATHLRKEKLRDFHRAIYAEIGTNLANLESISELDTYRDQMLEVIDTDNGFIPFMPREHNDRVFRSIVEDIHILPRTSIDPVVAYYSQLAVIETLVEDMRGDTFKKLAPARRKLIYCDYIEMKKQAFSFGTYAQQMIEAYADGGKTAAKALEKRPFNIRGAGPSGPSQE